MRLMGFRKRWPDSANGRHPQTRAGVYRTKWSGCRTWLETQRVAHSRDPFEPVAGAVDGEAQRSQLVRQLHRPTTRVSVTRRMHTNNSDELHTQVSGEDKADAMHTGIIQPLNPKLDEGKHWVKQMAHEPVAEQIVIHDQHSLRPGLGLPGNALAAGSSQLARARRRRLLRRLGDRHRGCSAPNRQRMSANRVDTEAEARPQQERELHWQKPDEKGVKRSGDGVTHLAR